jgi:23S rRNA pseudouridine955/2504/2580 synthase
VKPDYRVRIGDKVRVPPVRVAAANPARPQAFGLPIVHEDASCWSSTSLGRRGPRRQRVSHGVIEIAARGAPGSEDAGARAPAGPRHLGLLWSPKKRSALVELHRMLREGEVEKDLRRGRQGRPAKSNSTSPRRCTNT